MTNNLLWLQGLVSEIKRQSELLGDITDDTAINNKIYKNLRECTRIAARAITSINDKIVKAHKVEEPKFITPRMIKDNLYVKEFPMRVISLAEVYSALYIFEDNTRQTKIYRDRKPKQFKNSDLLKSQIETNENYIKVMKLLLDGIKKELE